MIEAIFFDLDGTLLDVDMDDFLDRYLLKLSTHLNFAEPKSFARNLWASTGEMVNSTDPTLTNQDAFMQHFITWVEQPQNEIMQLIAEFYQQIFPTLQDTAGPFPHTATTLTAARELQCPLVLATNPIFPLTAIQHRMTWAGLTTEDFSMITSYENMHFAKPNPHYYLEIAQMLKVEPSKCIMVGNDLELDIRAAGQAGLKTFYIDAAATSFNQDKNSGRLEDFPLYLESLSIER
ncbi:MAG TPA: HAD family hydrolase [Oscillospiraceae bacterium]|nr:HAD family hydrolase [Oscillospiraceae bacterium]